MRYMVWMFVGGAVDGGCRGMAPNDNTKYWKTAVPVLAFFRVLWAP